MLYVLSVLRDIIPHVCAMELLRRHYETKLIETRRNLFTLNEELLKENMKLRKRLRTLTAKFNEKQMEWTQATQWMRFDYGHHASPTSTSTKVYMPQLPPLREYSDSEETGHPNNLTPIRGSGASSATTARYVILPKNKIQCSSHSVCSTERNWHDTEAQDLHLPTQNKLVDTLSTNSPDAARSTTEIIHTHSPFKLPPGVECRQLRPRIGRVPYEEVSLR
eukprot:Gregarina_sp_Poly_1__1333@NODE_132_length_13232_cov_209_776377_g118_i0_p9_GENE_NODE_132_length_13232_cov_209_776377_g118_i0NODE_132_length_13232_cov_209_776377_g118_i0_p9_ORF_typecomplete_len221_score22_26DUF2764/PF10962_8/0_021CCDC14/PF15254_6/0_096HALZ/PF02183_18/1Fungal_TACC/PF12709_7/0_8NRBF2/PF08961_10/0_74NRBF2/PF08961_10/3_4e03_NODE_132_length_13232_cov_209_776377_g118_i087589420